MKKKVLWGFIGIVFLVGLIYLFFPKKVIYEVVPRKEKIAKEEENFPENEVMGWIRVQGTDIDYPILDSTLPDDKMSENYVWKNTLESEKLEDHTIIYGHNIQNVSSHPLIQNKSHLRFEQLLGFVYYDYAKENLYLQYSNKTGDYLFKIYSISFFDTTELTVEEEEKNSYIEKAKKDSFYHYDVDVTKEDTLITLITCTRFYGGNQSYEFKIDGRLLRKGEKATTYTVKKNKKVYDGIEKKLKEGEDDEEKL